MRPNRKRIMEEPAPSQDRWLVSYADFMTLLLGFFIVLFASSYRDSQTIRRVAQAIHIGFQDLGAFAGGESAQGSAYQNLTPTASVFTPGLSAAKLDNNNANSSAAGSPVDIAELRKQLEGAVGQELKNHEVVMRETPEGFVISLKDLGFFNSGQAALLPGAAEKIERIANVLAQHGLDLRVEGHSDNQPIHTPEFRSNWELSTARAMTVVMLLVNESGFDPKRISVAGYGQYHPIADNATPDGRKENRRVDLVVVASTPKPHAQ